MKAGVLRYPVEIYNKEIITNSYGQEESNYVLSQRTKAGVYWDNQSSYKDGDTGINGLDMQYADNAIDILVRSYVDIHDDSRIKLQGKLYRIISWHRDLRYRDIYATIAEIKENTMT